ncbi:MAG: hypothetical protein AAGC95_15925 [Pseudomonadota bacterium]
MHQYGAPVTGRISEACPKYNSYTARHSGHTNRSEYDGAGRLTQTIYETSESSVPFTYYYDKAGNLTQHVFPDRVGGSPSRFYTQYGYDALNRVTRVCLNAPAASCAAQAQPLALIDYDRLSRRASLAYGNGTVSTYDYTKRGDLKSLDWDLPSAANDFAYSFTYNGAGQTKMAGSYAEG